MKKIKILLLLVLISSLIYCAFNVYKIFKEEKDAADIKEELIELIDIPDIPSNEPEFTVDFSELEKINPDIVGWIVIEGTQINYPIVQGKNNSFYLNHSFDKKWSGFGSIFMDFNSTRDFTDYNTFIYGHHTKDGSMFGEVYKYMDYNFYKEHPSFKLYTPNGNYNVNIFSAYVADTDSESYNQKYSSLEDYRNYLDLVISKSNYNTNIEVDSTKDKIITLYSCSREGNWRKNDRYFIHGILEKY
ncbi:MAG: class B sortase [Bacilli bacterium]|nr:class B sortase [Bacilli bacterium]